MITIFEMMVAYLAAFMLGIGAGVSMERKRWEGIVKQKTAEIARLYEKGVLPIE